MVLGDDGIIGQAQAAKTAHENAEDDYENQKSNMEMTIQTDYINNNENIKFNNGYLTNVTTECFKGKLVTKTVDEILADLPEGYSIENLTSDGNVQTGSTIMNANGKKVGTIIIYGDVSGDGKVNARDRIISSQKLGWQEPKDIEPYQLIVMDVNNDGRVDENDINDIGKFVGRHEIEIEQNRKALNPNDITVFTRKDKIDEYIRKIPSTFEKEWYVENDLEKYYKVKLGENKINLSTLTTDYVKIYDATGTEITSGDVGAGAYIKILYAGEYSKCVVFE